MYASAARCPGVLDNSASAGADLGAMDGEERVSFRLAEDTDVTEDASSLSADCVCDNKLLDELGDDRDRDGAANDRSSTENKDRSSPFQ